MIELLTIGAYIVGGCVTAWGVMRWASDDAEATGIPSALLGLLGITVAVVWPLVAACYVIGKAAQR